ncbi:MAG: hypothetical protein M1821_004925 [Bathelium mastoideum]|nr:MAG: hypothetical protein M1821_004925 [Bathelium mastoideum]
MDRDDSPNFFHASDAKAQTTAPRQPELKKAPTFVYADGREEGQIRTVNVPSPATSAEDKPKVPTKFFYADGSVDQAQTFPLLSPPISVSSSRSSFIGSPTQAIPPLLSHSQIQPTHPRSASPPKENIHLSYRKGVSQIIPVHASRQRTTSISAASTPVLSNQPHFDIDGTPRRRSSAASSTAARARTHTKTASMSSLDLTPRKSSNLQTSSPISPAPANSSEPSSPTDQLSSAPKPSTALSPLSSTWPRSPTKAAAMEGSPDSTENNSGSNTTLQNLNELAAKARHDRKVLDLEISNSSLLAINRSLEREIRKQKTELRRFRRLTRQSSLRNFSMASSARSTSYGGSTAEDSGVSGVGCGIDGLDLDDEDEDDEDDDFDSEDYSDDEDEGEGEGGERKKEKDAKRLRLDLSKHREILVDSQKVNQSIKRCMGFTEELISQGKRALEYKVRVSDVKLGGRVLIEDEVEGDADELGDEIGLKDHKNGENPNAENKAREMDQSLEAF